LSQVIDRFYLALVFYPQIFFVIALTSPAVGRLSLRKFLPWLPFTCLFAGLLYGALQGGSPTHHPERSLLPLGIFATLMLFPLLLHLCRKSRRALLISAISTLCIPHFIWFLGSPFRPARFYGDRQAEVNFASAAAHLIPQGSTVLLSTDDYGYLAFKAALGPTRNYCVHLTHDPRIEEPTALADAIATESPDFLILSKSKSQLKNGPILQTEGFRLFDLREINQARVP
ncbi:MAG: hypothetical protein MK135_12900, partial [Polyangiaceae bacterium]|nr:hypothetical protein [Polyangiaceae bacterium]